MDLSNKVTIVTGAASGIGAAIVEQFLAAGARVVAVDVDPSVELLANGFDAAARERLRTVVGDVRESETARRYTAAAIEAFGRIDVLINNAGIAIIKTITAHTEEEWDRVFDVNVKSIFWSAKHVVPEMQSRGGGLILNTGSISSVVGIAAQGAYGPSKGAVIQITRQMAIDYAKDNIRVNAVCPGTVDTPLLRRSGIETGDPEGFIHGLASAHPIGRISTPAEMASFYRFLASDEARFFTGAVLMIDGGFTAW
ncbi:MAG: glucose 1-dehydrogenase [Planctomyces sp.]|nr:glucose 1-dehydrogenase [Planctomyces sp.]